MKLKYFKILLFIIIMSFTFYYTIKWLDEKNINLDDDALELLLESSGEIKPKNRIINKIITTVRETDIFNPVSIMINNYDSNFSKEDNVVPTINTNDKIDKPVVYIYNTHQTEKYYSPKEINLNYSVLDASYYLQKRLKDYGIVSIVENLSVQDVLNSNNWNYATSYRVSKQFMEKRKNDNPSLKYYFDLHRDSVNKNISTITINGVKYAKTLFILGLENKDYKKTEKNLLILENWLNDNYKGISRGIYRKKGKGVNGIYNQDFSENCFLIEIGGEENTYEEVENTIDVISKMINYYIGVSNG